MSKLMFKYVRGGATRPSGILRLSAPDRNMESTMTGLKAAYKIANTRATAETFKDMIRIRFPYAAF